MSPRSETADGCAVGLVFLAALLLFAWAAQWLLTLFGVHAPYWACVVALLVLRFVAAAGRA